MLSLPGKIRKPDLLQEEVDRCLDIMRVNPIDSEKYKLAMARYIDLHKEQLEEKKLKESKSSRILDILATFGLATVTLSYEYWAPIPKSWGSAITRPFRHGFKLGFRQPKE